MAKAKAEPTFDEAMAQLKEIVESIEGGKLTLEESIEQFQQGQELLKSCKEFLDKAELRIAQIKGAELAAGKPVPAEKPR